MTVSCCVMETSKNEIDEEKCMQDDVVRCTSPVSPVAPLWPRHCARSIPWGGCICRRSDGVSAGEKGVPVALPKRKILSPFFLLSREKTSQFADSSSKMFELLQALPKISFGTSLATLLGLVRVHCNTNDENAKHNSISYHKLPLPSIICFFTLLQDIQVWSLLMKDKSIVFRTDLSQVLPTERRFIFQMACPS